jgi:stage IV sporulation protein FB
VKFKVFGFPVAIGTNAWFMVAVVLLSFAGRGPGALIEGLGWVLAVYGSILVHELGHAGVARKFGLHPISILLHGMGGTTSHRAPRSSRQSLLVSMAGPGMSLLLSVVAFAVAYLAPLPPTGTRLAYDFGFMNGFWTVFNLLPIFGLDGSKIALNGLALLGVSQITALRVVLVLSFVLCTGVIVGGLYLRMWFALLFAVFALRDTWALAQRVFRPQE